MERIDATDLYMSDLVLVEANITRYFPPPSSASGSPSKDGTTQVKGKSPAKAKAEQVSATITPFSQKGKENQWIASLELRAISLLGIVPRPGASQDTGPSFEIHM